MRTTPRIVKQITTRPPMAPPTIAPMFVGLGVEDTDEEFTTVLELDAGTEDVSTTVAVGCEAESDNELVGAEVELDCFVVVAFAAFGTGKSLSVRASAPQAMYSKD
jgi:hypothetical protein